MGVDRTAMLRMVLSWIVLAAGLFGCLSLQHISCAYVWKLIVRRAAQQLGYARVSQAQKQCSAGSLQDEGARFGVKLSNELLTGLRL